MAKVKAKQKQGKLVIKVKVGALHSALGVKQDKPLTTSEKEVHKNDSPLMVKRKVFAQNAAKWHH